jgi:hypothetical protein
MAARENQGLQIALIVFVLFTILLSVTTFLFVRNYQQELQHAKNESEAANKAKDDLAKVQLERDTLALRVGGYPQSEKQEAIEKTWTKDMADNQAYLPPTLPDDQKNYRKLVGALQDAVKKMNTQMAKQDTDLRKANDTLAQKAKEFDDTKQALQKDKDKALEDYLTEREKIKNQLAEIVATQEQLSKAKAKTDTDLASMQTKLQGKIDDMQKKLATSETTVKQEKQRVNELETQFNVNALPAGKVSWVNQKENIAYINLGSDDRLHKRITFSVYDPSTTDVSAQGDTKGATSNAVSKGSIEVVDVTEPHMAECRILKHSISNPILPGDVIYTPVWRPGQQDHFALVGVMDIAGDGTDDRQRVRDVISMNGGIIDAEIGAEGKAVGTINLNTRYVVIGDLEKTKKPVTGSFDLLKQAKDMGVETITLSKFLDMMGYTPKLASKTLAPEDMVPAPIPGEPARAFRPRLAPTQSTGPGK